MRLYGSHDGRVDASRLAPRENRTLGFSTTGGLPIAVGVLRPVCLLALLACCLAMTGEAVAGGPVFVVVPTRAGGSGSLRHAILDRIGEVRHELGAARRAQRRDAMQLRRARAETVQAADPFPAEDEAVRLTSALAVDARRVGRLQRQLRGLELALRPAALPAGFASEPPSAVGAYAVTVAERYLGVRYLWGGSNPEDGFDCSGFVQFVYAQLGIRLPHYAASQYATSPHVDAADVEPGDLVFFEPRADGPGHVGIYVGGGIFIEAPHTGDVVKFEPVEAEANLIGYVGATRPTPAATP